MRPFLLARLALFLVLAAPALFAECDAGNPQVARDFARQPEDVVAARHLELVRPFAGTGHLEVNVCAAAQLRVRSRANLDHLRLVVDLADQPGGRPIEDYVQRVRVDGTSGSVDLRLPAEAHATVTLEVPMTATAETEINLGKGDVDFDAFSTAGAREINLGAGHLDLTLGGDTTFHSLAMNIGLGSLHDHRPKGRNAHFVVARTESGSGQGDLSVNIGAGTMNIRE